MARIPLLNFPCSSWFFLLETKHTIQIISLISSFLKLWIFFIISTNLDFFNFLSISSLSSYYYFAFYSSANLPTRISFFPFSYVSFSGFAFSRFGSILKAIVMNLTTKSKIISCPKNLAATAIKGIEAQFAYAKSLI